MALTGNEILYVQGISAAGTLAATTEQTTTRAIADLAGGGEGGPLVYTSITTAGNGVLTAAGIVGGVIARSGPSGAFSDATDTAAAIYAATNNVVGAAFLVTIENTTPFLQTITAGTGVTLPATVIIQSNTASEYLVTVNSATTATLNFVGNKPLFVLPAAQFTTGITTTTFAAGQLTGANNTVYTNTQATPGSIATRTATQMIADIPNARVGLTWITRIVNGQGTGTLTVTAGTDVTLTGTATIAANTWREFTCTITSISAHTITMQNIGTGTFS